MIAPIVLFVYNRPDHTRQTIEALAANFLANESELFIYSDAPKTQEATERVLAVRSLVKKIQGFKSVTIVEQEKNWGLADSIINGVTTIVKKFGKVIVLEDDMITSPYFLTYMNDALMLYENDRKVASIHGYIYPVKKELPDYFFLRGADCWGWATWERAWSFFNPDAHFLLNELKRQKLDKLFNFNNSYNYTGMLRDQEKGKISSWAIRWYASTFLTDMYTLYPGKSFVKNIGLDGSGTHCGISDNYKIDFFDFYKTISLIDVCDSIKARESITKYFLARKRNLFIRLIKRILVRVRP